jgi:excisionase family DNA binding protein
MNEQLLTAEEAAKVLNVSLPRLYELARTGTIPVVRLGRQVRIPGGLLEAWIVDGGRALPDRALG